MSRSLSTNAPSATGTSLLTSGPSTQASSPFSSATPARTLRSTQTLNCIDSPAAPNQICNGENPSMMNRVFPVVAIAASLFAFAASSHAQSAPQWVGTWATSPYLADGGFAARPLSGTTLREIAHISIGGPQVRVRFTNEYGTDPLTIADAHVALSAGGGAIQSGSDHALTFGGAASFTIPPGAAIYSDPTPLTVVALSDVAVSFYLPPQVM